jgi:hypothetical protein
LRDCFRIQLAALHSGAPTLYFTSTADFIISNTEPDPLKRIELKSPKRLDRRLVAGPERCCCLLRHPTHGEPSVLEFDGILYDAA